jgi:hypothetical protein
MALFCLTAALSGPLLRQAEAAGDFSRAVGALLDPEDRLFTPDAGMEEASQTSSRSELRRLQPGLRSDQDTTAKPRLMHSDLACVSPFGSATDPAASVAPIEIELCWRTGVFGTTETVGISTVFARRAVCLNSARTDPCGGTPERLVPYRDP